MTFGKIAHYPLPETRKERILKRAFCKGRKKSFAVRGETSRRRRMV